jgi:3-phosphoshikimate 1-carboxyvinyltransferase
METIHKVEPVAGPLKAMARVPGSKSLTNRALICAALADGVSELQGALWADDVEAMIAALDQLGVGTRWGENDTLTVGGTGGRFPTPAGEHPPVLDARMSGTTSRFLLPLLPLVPGPVRLDGAPSLRARPMADGLATLRDLGAAVVEDGEPGHLPVRVHGPDVAAEWGDGVDEPRDVAVVGKASSQFLSGLLLAAPGWPGGLSVSVDGPLVSRAYVDMTVEVMRAFGADVHDWENGWAVRSGPYRAGRYQVEPDASAASYFFAAAAITGGEVTVRGLGAGSLQGDLMFVDVLEQMGCQVERSAGRTTVRSTGALRGVDVDMGDLSDTAQTLAAVAVFADSPTRLRGIGFIRHKETDRIGNVVAELRRCGIDAEEEADGYLIRPGTPSPATVQTYDDHRMAMSFALLGLRSPGITIADPGCVAKTFPGYWDELQRLTTA